MQSKSEPTASPARVVREGDFRAFPLASLRVDSITDFDIYIRPERNAKPVLYRAKHLPISAQILINLMDHGHPTLLVPASQEPEYRRYIEKHLPEILTDPAIEVGDKSDVLYTSAQNLVAEVMAEPRSSELVKRSKSLVESASDFLRTERGAFRHLLSLVSSDYYTYTHSVNVFVYSMCLAQRLGFTDPALLREFGEGVLLHDVGKSLLDPAILRVRGGLSREQWEQMKAHPVYGYDILREHGTLSELALDVVRHHHEKLTGSGYPDQLTGSKINPLVRVSTIADIFDALTTRRTYKAALRSFDALDLMRHEMMGDLDEQFFRVFIELMGSPDN
jgi:HD-GYP domain-containing protein (c-di-GMP phosphodiesterase class II)